MGQYDTSGLHRRQQTDEVGHAILGSAVRSWRQRRALLVPLAVLAVGVLLGRWGPLPGLDVVLMIGAALGLVMSAAMTLTDGLS